MYKRIKELSVGSFIGEKPLVSFSTRRIEIQVIEGRDYVGEFVVTSQNHVTMKGYVYSSNYRMECVNRQFEDETVRVAFKFHSDGLVEGDIQQGEFYYICNKGEYNLSFVATVIKEYPKSEQGEIRSLAEFASLSEQNFEQARTCFASDRFVSLLGQPDSIEYRLYQYLRKNKSIDFAMEEFLVAMEWKRPVSFSVAKKDFILDAHTEECFFLELKKDSYGYGKIEIHSEVSFLTFEKTELLTYEFVGSVLDVPVYIDKTKLHAGRNFGRILLSMGEICEEVLVCVVNESEEAEQKEYRIQSLKVQLTKCYLDYRVQRIVTGAWAEQSLQKLEELEQLAPDDIYEVMRAQIYFVNEQRQEAETHLREFRRQHKKKDGVRWGYYLYVNGLMEYDKHQIDDWCDKLSEVFKRYPDSLLLFWCELMLREDYLKDSYERLKVIKNRVRAGCCSPYLYVEVMLLYQKEPFLLSQLEEFEIKVLCYGRKEQLLTEEICKQMLEGFRRYTVYDGRIVRLLETCWQILDSNEALEALCSYLIRTGGIQKRYFSYFAKGIEQKLRVNGLYEAYIATMEPSELEEIPMIILMYFKYNTQIPYPQRATLYAHMVSHKEYQRDIYEQQKIYLDQFAVDMLKQKKIDKNLAVIYQDLANRRWEEEEIRMLLEQFRHVCQIACGYADIVNVIVLGKETKVVPMSHKEGYLTFDSKEYRMVLYDCKGRYQSAKEVCRVSQMLQLPDEQEERITGKEEKEAAKEVTLDDWTVLTKDQRSSLLHNEMEKDEPDDRLGKLCYEMYRSGTYSEKILQYLVRHYEGATKILEQIWKRAKETTLSTTCLEERILMQMMYTEEYVESIGEIYKRYETNGTMRVKSAYVNYFSYLSIIQEAVVPEYFKMALEHLFTSGEEVCDIAELAYMKELSLQEDWTEDEMNYLSGRMEKYVHRGVVFRFYKKFPTQLQLQHQILDKEMIEYHGKKHQKIVVHYKKKEEQGYQTQILREIYDGVYVGMFVLFFGDDMQYYLTEQSDMEEIILGSDVCKSSSYTRYPKGSRYDRLNDILMAVMLGEDGKAEMQKTYYEQLDILTHEKFTMIE